MNAHVALLLKLLQKRKILDHQRRMRLNGQKIRRSIHHGFEQFPCAPQGPFLRRIRLGYAGHENPDGLGVAGGLQPVILRTIGLHGSFLDVQEPPPRPSPHVIGVPLSIAVHPAQRVAERTAPIQIDGMSIPCLLYTSPSPRDRTRSRMPSSA